MGETFYDPWYDQSDCNKWEWKVCDQVLNKPIFVKSEKDIEKIIASKAVENKKDGCKEEIAETLEPLKESKIYFADF